MNFIDEKGLGNLTNIFTRTKDYEHQRRARKIMTFIYNYKNVHEIFELSRFYNIYGGIKKKVEKKSIIAFIYDIVLVYIKNLN